MKHSESGQRCLLAIAVLTVAAAATAEIPSDGTTTYHDRDGDTDQADLGTLLANYGQVCP